MRRFLPLTRLGVALCAALFSACVCNPPPPLPDAGADSGGDGGGGDGEDAGDSGTDAGVVDAGRPCRIDDDCQAWNEGLRCDDQKLEDGGAPSYQCTAARGCLDDSNCGRADEKDYCYHYGLQCRCVTPEPNDAGTPGVCRRRRGVCEECTEDSQCGEKTSGVFDPPGKCDPLQGDSSGKKYCFQTAPCSCGMVNRNGYCQPQGNSCAQVGCDEDRDCPGGSVCNVARCLCEARCRWDFRPEVKGEAPPGCPPGKVCWVDQANLEPASPYFGAGRCTPPCESDEQCTNTNLNPYGGSKLKCAAEQLAGGGLSPKRCRANGQCMDDHECPDQPPESIYLGYCDRSTFACMADCRVGADPVTGQGYRDCRAGFKCVTQSSGVRECVQQTCLEQGGARMACRRGQYCCGEDKNFDGVADPCPPVNQRETNNCYDAPQPPFCLSCKSHDDCKNYTPPAWLTPCANGSKSPSCSPLPNVCVYAGDRPNGAEGINFCLPSTYNDSTPDDAGVPKDYRGCPAGYGVEGIRPKLVQGDNYCNTNADCSRGNDGGLCAPDLGLTLQDGGHPLACLCDHPTLPSACPNEPDGGVTSVCRFGIAKPRACFQTVVCTPSPGMAYRDAGPPDFGCGL